VGRAHASLETTQIHHAARQRGGCMAARDARSILGEAVEDRDVLALDEAGLLEALSKCPQIIRGEKA